ncbi:MAG: TMEM175 family protein [Reichenbachiella sp.]|uniref:TMEM175 family protein n=1 Tax=Reichenbachiella sp. TaxID=2184521 RepID=UPI0032674907
MIRSTLKEKALKDTTPQFRFRGVDNTRIEALSDGVFAIATALLVISSSIPETYAELLHFIHDLVPFAICMALLMLIWFQHYVFFIRYGFKDAKIVAVNTLLLFLILFYIYPLKFLMQLLYDMFGAMFTGNKAVFQQLFTEVIRMEDTPNLMVIYGLGAASIFITLTIMYSIAYKRAEELELTPVEKLLTKFSMQANLLMAAVPLVSSLFCLLPIQPNLAFTVGGFIYWAYPVVMIPFSIRNRKLLSKINLNIK